MRAAECKAVPLGCAAMLAEPSGVREDEPEAHSRSFIISVPVGVGLVAAGLWLYWLTRGTTFFQDEWVWVLYRRGNDLGTFLRPHNQHLSLVPLIVYRLLLSAVGLRHYD